MTLYLDHAATSPLRPEAAEAMAPYLGDRFGNPSGIHEVSRRAKNAVEEARERAAALLGASRPLDIVFTGGGTESDNLGVAGPALAAGRGGVVVSAVEHEAVLETTRFLGRLGCATKIVAVDGEGRVSPEEVAGAIDSGTAVVSVMAANNETGARQAVAKVAAAVREATSRTVVHCDAVQAFVSDDVTMEALGADLVTIAAHKFGGPKGVGILCVAGDLPLEPVLHGGGQELGRRSGTHDVAGIVGMVAAMEAAVADRDRLGHHVAEARRRFESRLAGAVGAVPTVADDRLVQHSHLRIPGVDAETLLIRLDALGLAASAGSACQSGAVETSHVLRAMGLDDAAARECVRFSFGWTTEPPDGDRAAEAVIAAVSQ